MYSDLSDGTSMIRPKGYLRSIHRDEVASGCSMNSCVSSPWITDSFALSSNDRPRTVRIMVLAVGGPTDVNRILTRVKTRIIVS